jgi:hypothetical protein
VIRPRFASQPLAAGQPPRRLHHRRTRTATGCRAGTACHPARRPRGTRSHLNAAQHRYQLLRVTRFALRARRGRRVAAGNQLLVHPPAFPAFVFVNWHGSSSRFQVAPPRPARSGGLDQSRKIHLGLAGSLVRRRVSRSPTHPNGHHSRRLNMRKAVNKPPEMGGIGARQDSGQRRSLP